MPTRTQQADLLAAAYASHGDTKHPLLFPASPRECFDFAASAFDFSDRLQTPIIVMSDLDLGMNEITSEAFEWNDNRKYDRGKVLNAEDLDNMEVFGRYLDVDGDGIGYRTLPGAHPSKGSFFTRGTSRDEYATYTEDPDAYSKNMDRLLSKWETAKSLLPAAEINSEGCRAGIIYYGTTSTPMTECLAMLDEQGIELDTMRVRSFPFGPEVVEFIDNHEIVFMVEQNRDAQMKMLMTNELDVLPSSIQSILYYGGMSISADFIVDEVLSYYQANNIPRIKVVST